MNQYKFIGFDMDGTLLNSKKQVSPRTLSAINKAADAGFYVALSTGRCISELRDFESIFDHIRYYICESGALIYDSREKMILHSETISAETMEQVFKRIAPFDVMPYLMSGGLAYTSPDDIRNSAHFNMGIYQNMMERITEKVDNVAGFYLQTRIPVEKLNLYSASVGIRGQIAGLLNGLPLTAAYAEGSSLELSPLDVSKASGLKWLCGYLGLSLEETIIVGDADNDAEAMKAAGLPIAMGNALPHIQALCRAVVADNDHDGCAEAVEKYLMGQAVTFQR